MAITVTHPFVSAKGDGSDATLVRPSNWNASHNINMATSKIVGRLTAGPGLAEELPVTAYMIGLLNTADFAALAVALGLPTTGDAKLTYKPGPDTGWIFANDGTIGDVGSGATVAAANTLALFTLFYDTMEYATPLQTSSGAGTTRAAQGSAATAFNAKCRMVIPKTLGRALITGGGTGAGLSARYAGQVGGEETHQMTLAELVSHAHTQQGAFAGSGTFSGSGTGSGSGSVSASGSANGNTGDDTPDHAHHMSFNTGSEGAPDHLHGLGGNTGAADRSLNHDHTKTWTGGSANAVVVAGSGAGGHGGGGAYGPSGTLTLGGGGVDHLHSLPLNTGASDRSLAHAHSVNGDTWGAGARHHHAITSVPVSVSGTCSVTTINVSVSGSVATSTTISGPTVAAGSSTPFNVMQPWTAWNVMIRL